MNRKKLVILLIVASLILSGCNLSSGNDIPGYTTYGGDSQTVTQENTEEAPSATPENTEATTPDTEATEESTSDTEETDKTDESEETSESEEETTTSTETEASSSSSSSPAASSTKTTTTTTTAKTTAATTTTAKTTTTASTTQPVNAEPSPPTIHSTTADGTLTSTTSLAIIDYSNTSDGYVMAKYTGKNSRAKVLITYPNGTTYNYDLNTKGSYEVFPLTGGNGSYTVGVYENIVDNKYAEAATCAIKVSLASSTAPYLRPSQFVNYSKGDVAVTKASQLCAGATTALQKIERIYSWVVENVTYDNALADDVRNKKVTSYLANPTKIINERKGICYDYAVGIAAMLRSQNIPTQVVFGNVQSVGYHAWVNVYTPETGWVYGAIYFDGSNWRRMDPTFASSSKSSDAIMKFIDTNSNYTAEKLY